MLFRITGYIYIINEKYSNVYRLKREVRFSCDRANDFFLVLLDSYDLERGKFYIANLS